MAAPDASAEPPPAEAASEASPPRQERVEPPSVPARLTEEALRTVPSVDPQEGHAGVAERWVPRSDLVAHEPRQQSSPAPVHSHLSQAPQPRPRSHSHGRGRHRAQSFGKLSVHSVKSARSVGHIFENFGGEDLHDSDADDDGNVQEPTQLSSAGEAESLRLLREGECPQETASDRAAGNGDLSTFMTLVKAFVGPAHLYLAKAFANAGVWTGIFGLAACAALNGFCVVLLVRAQGQAGRINVGTSRTTSFAGVGQTAFREWRDGMPMYWLVEAALVASQLGLVTMYFIFIGQTVLNAMENLSNCAGWATGLSVTPLIFIQAGVQIPMALLRHLQQIAFFAILADIFIFTGMSIVIVENVREISLHQHSSLTGFQGSTIALFLGAAILTFEGIGLMLPIHDAMANRERFVPLMSGAIALCCTLFIAFALLGYMARGGDDIKTNLLLAMPSDNRLTQVVELLYSLAVLLTFPLQAFPAYRIIELATKMRSGRGDRLAKWRKNGVRTGTVLLLACIAWAAGKHLDNFVALLGGLTMCPLAFVFPSLFHYKLCAETRKQRIVDLTVAGLGIAIVIFVTVMAIKDWITGSSEEEDKCVPR